MAEDKFLNFLKNQKTLSHAYLVLGPFNEEAFRELTQIQAPDVLTLEGQPVKIGPVRELIRWLYLKPHSSKHKLAVIWKIDQMTIEAGNALLKVLEEPPPYAILILQADKKERILPTIISRCQIIRQDRVAETLPPNFIPAAKIAEMSFNERFRYVQKLAEDENLNQIINQWEGEMREKILRGEDKIGVLKDIRRARSLLLTNTSVKLLLENLVLKF